MRIQYEGFNFYEGGGFFCLKLETLDPCYCVEVEAKDSQSPFLPLSLDSFLV